MTTATTRLDSGESLACWIDVDALWRTATRHGIERGNVSDLSRYLGVSPSTFSRVLAGERNAGADLLMRIRLCFGDPAFARIWRCTRG